MKIEYRELESGIRLIKLNGTLDMDGASSIDKQFVSYCAGENALVLVDLSHVNYLSSIGIPLLITTAKGIVSRGGKMAFLSPQANVKSVLDITGVSTIIRIYNNLETAQERMKAA